MTTFELIISTLCIGAVCIGIWLYIRQYIKSVHVNLLAIALFLLFTTTLFFGQYLERNMINQQAELIAEELGTEPESMTYTDGTWYSDDAAYTAEFNGNKFMPPTTIEQLTIIGDKVK